MEEEKEGRAAFRCLEFIIAGTCEGKVDISGGSTEVIEGDTESTEMGKYWEFGVTG